MKYKKIRKYGKLVLTETMRKEFKIRDFTINLGNRVKEQEYSSQQKIGTKRDEKYQSDELVLRTVEQNETNRNNETKEIDKTDTIEAGESSQQIEQNAIGESGASVEGAGSSQQRYSANSSQINKRKRGENEDDAEIERQPKKICDETSSNQSILNYASRMTLCLKCGEYVIGSHARVDQCFSEHMCDGFLRNYDKFNACIALISTTMMSQGAVSTPPTPTQPTQPTPPTPPPPPPPPTPPPPPQSTRLPPKPLAGTSKTDKKVTLYFNELRAKLDERRALLSETKMPPSPALKPVAAKTGEKVKSCFDVLRAKLEQRRAMLAASDEEDDTKSDGSAEK